MSRQGYVVSGSWSPRWAFWSPMNITKPDGSSYLRRLRIVETPWFGLLLHRIDGPDTEADPHDHPWWFASWVVRGGYDEIVWPLASLWGRGKIRNHWKRWSLHAMPLPAAHRITSVLPGTITVVMHGPRVKSWGFWIWDSTDGARPWIPWTEYSALYPVGDASGPS